MPVKTIEEVLTQYGWDMDWIQSAVDEKQATQHEANKYKVRKLEDALKDIETIVNGVIGEDEPFSDADRLHTVGVDTGDGFTKCNCGADYSGAYERYARNERRAEIRTNFNKVLRSK